MKRSTLEVFVLFFAFSLVFVLFFAFSPCGRTQSWSAILSSSQAINWSSSGVSGAGGIPARTTNCASLTSTATLTQINSALASCPSGETVSLAAGTYNINGTIQVPSNVTLRGAGANQTILNATGTGGGAVIGLGTGGAPYSPTFANITGGATNGSTSIVVSSTSGIAVGGYLVVTETNNASWGVTNEGSEGACTWCDGISTNGNDARGQIVSVTGVNGTTITISPGLYGPYTNSPVVYPITMTASYAGVENLQIYANSTGYSASIWMQTCAYCWARGIENNYADADQVDIDYGFHDEVRDSYFSNAFQHSPGDSDSEVALRTKSSANLIENNIMERLHASTILEWGAAGNVIAYNYMEAGYDSGSPSVLIGGIDFHGANPQFNLMEGNVGVQIYQDSVWGSSTDNTSFRNWVQGSAAVDYPETAGSRATITGGTTVACGSLSANKTCYPFQASRAFQISYLAIRSNLIGNVVGSVAQTSNIGYGSGVSTYNSGSGQTDALQWPTTRVYDATVYGYTFGYGEAADTGTGSGDSTTAYTTALLHGNYGNISSAIAWKSGLPTTLPASFYQSGKPSWWGSLPYPVTGPDVTGGSGPGGHTYGNPAETCFLNVMHGVDGGAGGPYTLFNASTCYGGGVVPAPPTNVTGTVVQQ